MFLSCHVITFLFYLYSLAYKISRENTALKMSEKGNYEAPPPLKRYRRVEEEDKKEGSEDENLEDYVPYVRVKDRRKQKLVKLGRITEIKEDTKPSGAGGSG